MSLVFLIIWYIFLILLSTTPLVLRILTSFTNTIQEMETYILLGAIIYGVYMIILVSCKSKKDSKDSKREALISNHSIDVFRDHWFKFLFCLCVGAIFLPKLIINLESNFSKYSGKDWKVITDLVLSQIVVPLIVLIDIFMIPRRRVPSPLIDLIILIAIVIVFIIIEFSNKSISFKIFLYYLGLLITNVLFSFNGYVLYDYILYKKVGGSNGFNLFNK